VNADDALAEQSEAHRMHLRAVAYREARLSAGGRRRSSGGLAPARPLRGQGDRELWRLADDRGRVRVCACFDHARTAQREDALGSREPDPLIAGENPSHPESEALLADSVGVALLAFVLHDMFAVPFEEIASVMGRTSTASRQLASRGCRRVQALGTTRDTERAVQLQVVPAFLAASRNGDFKGLMELPDPKDVIRSDSDGVDSGAPRQVPAQPPYPRPSLAGPAREARIP
jgi:hypothetical protein